MHSCEFHFHGGVLTMDDGASSPFTWFHASCVVSSFLRVTWFHASLSAPPAAATYVVYAASALG